MNQANLDELERLLSRATSGPWYVRNLDDEYYMSAIAISTLSSNDDPESYGGGGWPSGQFVAATLIQQPRLVDHKEGRWDVDAELIVRLRNLGPELIALAKEALDARS